MQIPTGLRQAVRAGCDVCCVLYWLCGVVLVVKCCLSAEVCAERPSHFDASLSAEDCMERMEGMHE